MNECKQILHCNISTFKGDVSTDSMDYCQNIVPNIIQSILASIINTNLIDFLKLKYIHFVQTQLNQRKKEKMNSPV